MTRVLEIIQNIQTPVKDWDGKGERFTTRETRRIVKELARETRIGRFDQDISQELEGFKNFELGQLSVTSSEDGSYIVSIPGTIIFEGDEMRIRRDISLKEDDRQQEISIDLMSIHVLDRRADSKPVLLKVPSGMTLCVGYSSFIRMPDGASEETIFIGPSRGSDKHKNRERFEIDRYRRE